MNRSFRSCPSSRWHMLKLSVRRPRAFHNTPQHFQTPHTGPATSPAASTVSRFDRFIARTPTKFLRTRLSALNNAPISTITSFLILHEITAVVPLFALAGFFHYTKWLPPFFAEGEWVLKGVELFGRYFKRKGWITSEDAQHAKDAAKEGEAEAVERRARSRWNREMEGSTSVVSAVGADGKASKRTEAVAKWWSRGEGGTRLVIEFATAYAVVKVLLPLRIMISIWGAPWFARWTTIPISNYLSRRRAGSKQAIKTAAGPFKNG